MSRRIRTRALPVGVAKMAVPTVQTPAYVVLSSLGWRAKSLRGKRPGEQLLFVRAALGSVRQACTLPMCTHILAVTWQEARLKAWGIFGREPNAILAVGP